MLDLADLFILLLFAAAAAAPDHLDGREVGVPQVEAGGHHDGAHRFHDQLVFLFVVHGPRAAHLLAQAAFAALEFDERVRACSV